MHPTRLALVFCCLPLLAQAATLVVKPQEFEYDNLTPCSNCQWKECFCVDLKRCDERSDSLLNYGQDVISPRLLDDDTVEKCPRFQTCCPWRDEIWDTPRTCGVHSSNFPWMLAIVDAYNNNEFVCGATLISLRIAVTSVDCVTRYLSKNQNLVVRAGLIRTFLVQFKKEQVIHIRPSVAFTSRDEGRPIALLILQDAYHKSSTINPACQPTRKSAPNSKSNCVMTGWGRSPSGRVLEIKYKTMQIIECGQVKTSTICAKQINTIPECLNAGSSLLCENSAGLYEIFGILSKPNTNCKGPITFTDIRTYRNWILKEAKPYVTIE